MRIFARPMVTYSDSTSQTGRLRAVLPHVMQCMQASSRVASKEQIYTGIVSNTILLRCKNAVLNHIHSTLCQDCLCWAQCRADTTTLLALPELAYWEPSTARPCHAIGCCWPRASVSAKEMPEMFPCA